MVTIDAFIDQVEHLPSAPKVLAEISQMVQSPDTDIDQIVRVIQTDPGLTAEVMRRCNSAYLGAQSPASDLMEAVTRLGLDAVYQLSVLLSGHGLFSSTGRLGSFDLQELWLHSVAAALIGQMLAHTAHANGSQVFTACILHDLGKVVLALGLGDEYAQILRQCSKQQMPTVATERALLRFDHAEVGARLLERWSFAPELVEAVRYHHSPTECGGRLPALVLLADIAANLVGYAGGQAAVSLAGRREALALAGLTAETQFCSIAEGFQSFREAQRVLTS